MRGKQVRGSARFKGALQQELPLEAVLVLTLRETLILRERYGTRAVCGCSTGKTARPGEWIASTAAVTWEPRVLACAAPQGLPFGKPSTESRGV